MAGMVACTGRAAPDRRRAACGGAIRGSTRRLPRGDRGVHGRPGKGPRRAGPRFPAGRTAGGGEGAAGTCRGDRPGEGGVLGSPGRDLRMGRGVPRGGRMLEARCWPWPRTRSRAPAHRPGLGDSSNFGSSTRRGTNSGGRRRSSPSAPDAPLSLGLLEMERGDFAAAEDAFRQALRLSPACHMALYWLANMHGASLSEDDLAALKARLRDPATGEEPRTRLLFALGQVHDARGEYRRRGKLPAPGQCPATSPGQAVAGLRSAGREALVDGLIRVFDRPFFASTGRRGARHEETGVRRRPAALRDHARRAGPGQPPFGPRSRRAHARPEGLRCLALDRRPRHLADRLRRSPPAAAHSPPRRGVPRATRGLAGGEADRVVDKLPENYLLVGLLTTLFPPPR